jgi:hypothetical protein
MEYPQPFIAQSISGGKNNADQRNTQIKFIKRNGIHRSLYRYRDLNDDFLFLKLSPKKQIETQN